MRSAMRPRTGDVGAAKEEGDEGEERRRRRKVWYRCKTRRAFFSLLPLPLLPPGELRMWERPNAATGSRTVNSPALPLRLHW